MLSAEQRQILLTCLVNSVPIPPEISQQLLLDYDLAQKHSGKASLAYRDAIERRNAFIVLAYNTLTGSKYARLGELAGRLIADDPGTDPAGQYLRQAIGLNLKMPASIKQLARLIEGKRTN